MFIACGVIGALLIIATIVFDDFIDELIPGLDFLTGPVIGAFLVAFGAFGWFAQEGPSWNLAAALAAALVGGVLFGGAGYRLTRLLMNQPTDATPTTESLIGKSARVVTPVRAGGLGEVIVELGGAPTKYSVTADADLAVGSAAVVIAIESPTKLRVQSEAEFWA